MDKVVIFRWIGDPLAGIYALCYMQVCAEPDATDEEILAVCNSLNPSGTTNGWNEVIRTVNEDPDDHFHKPSMLPGSCLEYPNRKHFIVLC